MGTTLDENLETVNTKRDYGITDGLLRIFSAPRPVDRITRASHRLHLDAATYTYAGLNYCSISHDMLQHLYPLEILCLSYGVGVNKTGRVSTDLTWCDFSHTVSRLVGAAYDNPVFKNGRKHYPYDRNPNSLITAMQGFEQHFPEDSKDFLGSLQGSPHELHDPNVDGISIELAVHHIKQKATELYNKHKTSASCSPAHPNYAR